MTSTLKLLLVLFLCCFSVCSALAAPDDKPVRVIFDTDMGSDCDDAGALALLHAYADLGKAEIVGCIYSSGKVPYGAAVVQAINVYYGRPHIPVGADHTDAVGDPVDKMTAEKLAKDTSAFGNTIIRNRDAIEQTRLNRRLLAKSNDRSITYLTVGHTKGLHDLLISGPDDISPLAGRELIKKKVKRWVALGALGADDQHFSRDYNFCFNGAAPYTKYVLEHFPAPAFFVDAGTDVMTGKGLKQTPPGNIVRTAYRDWLWNYEKKTLDDQRPSWDLTAVYFAVEGLGDFLFDDGTGRLELDIEKGCRWIPHAQQQNPQATHTFIRQKNTVAAQFADYLNKHLAQKPKDLKQ